MSTSSANYQGEGDQDIEKELDWIIEKAAKEERESASAGGDNMAEDDVSDEKIDKFLEQEGDEDEKGQAETAGSGKEEDGSGEPVPSRDSPSPTRESPERESSPQQREEESDQQSSDSPDQRHVHGQDEDTDDDYTLTDDQRQAMMELDKMKSEYDYANEEPPEYDVTERVKQLNEELQNEPTPVDGDREHKVGFKDNLVDLVAPPQVFSDSEEEGERHTAQDSTGRSTDNEQSKKGSENKVLIERDGKFELVNSDDVAAGHQGGPPLASASDQSLSPSPPGHARPATANGHNRQFRSPPQRRVQSAQHTREWSRDDEYSYDYRSPYALTDAQKTIKQERDKAMIRRQRKELERKKEEEEEKKRDNDDAFKAWLSKKREQAGRQRQQNKDSDAKRESKSDSDAGDSMGEEDRDNEGAFKEWLQVKAKQREKEKEMEREKMKEVQEGYYVRSRKECDKAYREWAKKKSQEQKNSKDSKRKKQCIHLLYLRRSRKSQALARAIQYSQSFRYVDYYGYRQ